MTEQHNTPEQRPGREATAHQVAVTVFVTAQGMDSRDAGHIAERAVEQALPAGHTITVHTHLATPGPSASSPPWRPPPRPPTAT
jgi:hypothetical protein